jgi:hypothetical protein
MAVSEVSISNQAVNRLGRQPIVSLDDDSDIAALCKAMYPARRRALLVEHPWNFAVTRQALVAVVDVPVYGFAFAFSLPTDPACLRVIDTSLDRSWSNAWSSWGSDPYPRLWQVEVLEGVKVLVANEAAVSMRYIFDVDDPSQFPPYFEQALSYDLAAEMAYPVTKSENVADFWRKQADRALSKAKAKDGQEGRAGSYYSPSLQQVRY